MISRRHTRLIIALLLPLMVLRALLPAGFMPVAEDGALRMAMCSDGLYPTTADHHGHPSPAGDEQQSSGSGSCPFALAAVNAAPPALTQIVARLDIDSGAASSAIAPVIVAATVRAQSARGPPSFSL